MMADRRISGFVIASLLSVALGVMLASCGEKDKGTGSAENGALARQGHEIIKTVCVGCHEANDKGLPSRIGGARKSPEGWEMTLVRMMTFHGVELTADQRRAVVKYLSETQGLAPSESAPYRYALERRTNIVEKAADPDLQVMCARCHSYARVALQRRDAEEWKLLANMHLGQWPTIEYQMLSRDRDWWVDASTEVPKKLSKLYPFTTKAWDDWKLAKKQKPEGRWRVVTYMPGASSNMQGQAQNYVDGILSVKSKGDDAYEVTYELASDGRTVMSGTYGALVYSGYEWRARGKFDGRDFREVAAMSPDGNSMSGRWFWHNANEVGGYIQAVRMDKHISRIMGLNGEGLKRGQMGDVTILGVGLEGTVDLGPGIAVETVSSSPERITVRATVAIDAPLGRRDIRVGKTERAEAIGVYDTIDRIVVTPGYGVARVGGGGGHVVPVSAQFEAVAYSNGPDKKPGTKDDYRIGLVQADWHTEPHDATAAKMKDQLFAGKITPQGRFLPSQAGPNPDRYMSAGNFGDLNVVASITGSETTVVGKSHLIVTSPRWNNPPIY
ncbi:quinohemoprotein amine dehydrogenase subunit alpha [Govanella unica]|uniref:Quinohemoprotein amine dehydrogenase subunit alpha n=1 Tax=Govanella unica TaxID=2975056 RepID=A0A9X3Z5Y6_9PROT|nr:quinohemoprotein amine dehydrogenase subunit alpha [Govania unica]MDA5192586.1 quinohemoprotein amine dehydrogenase subunit alpha [Govania unica]